VDHTFKETAKRFGIHHSTVSGWVKESEKQDKAAPYGDSGREKGKQWRIFGFFNLTKFACWEI
jgi:hypothetical protein